MYLGFVLKMINNFFIIIKEKNYKNLKRKKDISNSIYLESDYILSINYYFISAKVHILSLYLKDFQLFLNSRLPSEMHQESFAPCRASNQILYQ